MGEGKHTPGPWSVWTSCSWRRIGSRDHGLVCEPIVQHPDGHPDLYFRNGGEDGPDARLIAAAPDLLEALQWAKETIHALHDLTLRPDLRDEMWAIYDRASPEMKAINAAITKALGQDKGEG